MFGALPEAFGVQVFGGGGVVAGVVEERVGAELGVGLLLFELGAGGEGVEPVAVVGVAGGCGDAVVLAWAAPVFGVAALEHECPAFEDVCPVGFRFEVVAGGDAAYPVAELVCARGGCGWGWCLVEGAQDGVEGVAFLEGEGGCGVGASEEAGPCAAVGVVA